MADGDDSDAVKLAHALIDLQRSFKHAKWLWGAGVLVAAIFAAGVSASEFRHRYATTFQLNQAVADIERLTRRMDMHDERDRGSEMLWHRIADEVDDIHKYFRKLRP